MKDSCKKILNSVYDRFHKTSDPLYISLEEDSNGITPDTLQNDISALLSGGYLKEEVPLSDGYILAITEKGKKYVENGFQHNPVPQNTTFNLQNVSFDGNPIIGNNASFSNSVYGKNLSDIELNSTTTSFSELGQLIREKPDYDRPALLELLRALEKLEESSEPVRPGFFSRFSDLVKKHTDLIVPIGRILVQIFFSAK